jgi:hypothetical protein
LKTAHSIPLEQRRADAAAQQLDTNLHNPALGATHVGTAEEVMRRVAELDKSDQGKTIVLPSQKPKK